MKDNSKTNALRIVESRGIPHRLHTYEPGGSIDGVSVANKLGQDPAQVFKTLVAQGKTRSFYVFVIPVAAELDLKRAASSVGEKSVEMIHVKDLNKVTGYIRGGCSPIGMKKLYATRIDESAELYDTIIVSAGRIGMQLQLPPRSLAETCAAEFTALTRA